MKKWKPISLDDLSNLSIAVAEINSWGIHSLRIVTETKDGRNDIYIIDNTEELYYSGYRYEEAMNKLEAAFREDMDDPDAYFDCMCPGKYLADYESRCRYTKDNLKDELQSALLEGVCKYMVSNGIEYSWTDELRDEMDKAEEFTEAMKWFEKLLNNKTIK